jgi:hypothetical protein
VRPDEQTATEALHGVAVGIELEHDVEVRVEALVSESIAAGVAAQYGPDVLAVGIDVDVADGTDLPPAGELGPAFDLAIRIGR